MSRAKGTFARYERPDASASAANRARTGFNGLSRTNTILFSKDELPGLFKPRGTRGILESLRSAFQRTLDRLVHSSQVLANKRPRFKPLHVGQFRLLDLYPDSFNEALECELFISNISCAPPYEALSYCWGDHADKMDLRIDGTDWPITTSLHVALKYLRHESKRRLLWVDAVCINQDDHVERGAQVELMGRIFSQAREVVARLGVADDDARSACGMLAMFAAVGDDLTVEQFAVLMKSELSLCMTFLNRPWFTRIWTVQEALLGRRVVLRCGNVTLALEVWRKASELMMGPRFREAVLMNWHPDMITCVNERGQVLRMRLNVTFEASSFFQALSFCRRRDCSEPKDKVYGLLGIAPESFKIKVRHDQYPLRQVYEDFAVAMMRKTRCLDLLTHATSQYGQAHGPRWSSWAPDWRRQFDTGHYRATSCHANGRGDVCNAALDTGHVFSVEYNADLSTLGLPGVEIDTVKEIGPVWTRSSLKVTTAGEFSQYAQGWKLFLGCSDSALWRIILRDAVPRCAFDEIVPRPRLTREDCDSLQTSHGSCMIGDEGWQRLVNLSALHCVPFKTASGVIGQTAGPVVAGDIAFVLAGSSFPYILRPVPNQGGPGHYQLIGSCYIHDMMDGQAIAAAWNRVPESKHATGRAQLFETVYLN